MMKFFVKDFCETVQPRVVIFGMQVNNSFLDLALNYIDRLLVFLWVLTVPLL